MNMLIKVINDHNLSDMRFHVSMRRFFAVFTTPLRFDSAFPIHSLSCVVSRPHPVPLNVCVIIFCLFLSHLFRALF